jgi:hypothetical protein
MAHSTNRISAPTNRSFTTFQFFDISCCPSRYAVSRVPPSSRRARLDISARSCRYHIPCAGSRVFLGPGAHGRTDRTFERIVVTLGAFHFRVAFGLVGVARRDGRVACGRHRPSPPGRTRRNRGPSVRTRSLPRRSKGFSRDIRLASTPLGVVSPARITGPEIAARKSATRGSCNPARPRRYGWWPQPTPAARPRDRPRWCRPPAAVGARRAQECRKAREATVPRRLRTA